MKKIILIGLKDLRLIFRDRPALIFILLAPFALTIGMGLVTGGLSDSGGGSIQIQLALVNQDEGVLGQALVDLFASPDLAGLIDLEVLDDEPTARQRVDDDQAAAALIVPAGFSDSIFPAPGQATAAEAVQLQLYKNPTRPTSAGVIEAILQDFLLQVESARAGAQVAVTQLIQAGLLAPEDAAQKGQAMAQALAVQSEGPQITLQRSGATQDAGDFNLMAIMAPGMALMFLMFTTTNGGRSLLAERSGGTLPRLLVTPTTRTQVLAGKVFGVYLTGVVQVLILIAASSLIFSLNWGSPLGVLALVLAAVAGAVGWGMLITALARTSGQVGGIGSAVMLTFGVLGGTFIDLSSMPAWVQLLSKITPNAWGVDGFLRLASGAGLVDLGGILLALLAMGVILFAIAAVLLNRRSLASP